MDSLIKRLPARIAALEAKHGPNDPYVRDLKEQLRASVATQGQSAQDVWMLQAQPLTPKPELDDPNRPETEEDGIRAEAIRRLKVRRLLPAQQDQTPDSSK